MSKSESLSQFFKEDNKTVILPIDHGTVIPIDGLLCKPMELIEQVDRYVDGYVVKYFFKNYFNIKNGTTRCFRW